MKKNSKNASEKSGKVESEGRNPSPDLGALDKFTREILKVPKKRIEGHPKP